MAIYRCHSEFRFSVQAKAQMMLTSFLSKFSGDPRFSEVSGVISDDNPDWILMLNAKFDVTGLQNEVSSWVSTQLLTSHRPLGGWVIAHRDSEIGNPNQTFTDAEYEEVHF